MAATCCGKQKKQTWDQVLVVMRHSERLDFADEDAWFQHPDSRIYPMDPPITSRGRSHAKVQGRLLREFLESNGGGIDVIITSPYIRCVQTAVQVREVMTCRKGGQVPLLIDAEVSEVGIYKKPRGMTDPALLKSHLEFCSRRRSYNELLQRPDLKGVELLNLDDFVGIQPPFPEQRRAAHLRGLFRFSEWLERGHQTDLNFLIITHQDLVHTFCSMIKPEVCIEWVKYCGWGAAFIHRSGKPGAATKTRTPPAIHSLKMTADFGSGVRWSPYSVDPFTGQQMRWYPPQEDTGVAAIATTFSNQATAELEDMKRYADAQALQRAFKGNKTVSLLVGAMKPRPESDSTEQEARTVATKKVKQELDNQYEKVLINQGSESSKASSEASSRTEAEMISCERSAEILARREIIEPQPQPDSRSNASGKGRSFTSGLSSVNEGGEEADDRTEERYVNVSL